MPISLRDSVMAHRVRVRDSNPTQVYTVRLEYHIMTADSYDRRNSVMFNHSESVCTKVGT